MIRIILYFLFSFSCIAQVALIGEESSGSAAGGGGGLHLDANCVGYWRLNGTDGETDVVAGNDLTVSSGDTIPRNTELPSGWSGFSRRFVATDADYLERAVGSLTGGLDFSGADQAFSVSAKVRVHEFNSTVMSLIGRWDFGGELMWELGLSDASTDGDWGIWARISSDGTATSASFLTDDSLSTNTWYTLGMTYDDSNVICYVDGLPVTTNAYSAGIFNSSVAPFRIGANLEFDEGNYDLTDAIVFDRSLTSVEMISLHNGGDGAKGAND